MELSKLIDILELEFPPETAWSNDSIGLQIKSSKSEVNNVYLTLELDNESVNEAINLSADIIITFHPLIFSPLSSVRIDNRVGNLVSKIIKNDINLYSIHTNFDSHAKGTSFEFCRMLGLSVSEFLVPDLKFENKGMGVIVDVVDALNFENLLEKVSKVCNSPIKYNKSNEELIKRVAVLGGSGSSYMEAAIEKKCDILITADVKYHDFHAAQGRISIIDPGHYEMEQFVSNAMYNILSAKFKDELNFIKGKVVTNPVKYYPDNNYTKMQMNYLNNN